MSVDRITAAVRALAQQVPHAPECPALDDCHVIHGGCDMDYRCECDRDERVWRTIGEAVEHALYVAHDYGKLVYTDLDDSPAVRALETPQGTEL